MLWTFFLICSHSFIFDSIYLEDECEEGEEVSTNVFINLLRPCNWEETYHVGGDTFNAEGEYFLFLEYDDFENDGNEPGNAPLMDWSLDHYLEGTEYFHIGSDLDQELTINAGDNFLIATNDASPELTHDADELTNFIHPDNLFNEDEDGEHYSFIWLVLEDEHGDLYVIDTYNLATLNGGVAKRNYLALAAEIDDGCEENGECWSEYQWGMSIYGYKQTTWSVQSATECNPIVDVGTIPESACVEEDEDGGEGEEDETPEEDSGTNSPTMVPTKNPTRTPTTNPTASPTDASTSTTSSADAATGTADSTGSSSSKSVTSEVWFFIVLFIAGMVVCGFFMYFCKRGESVDAGFIAAADYEEGFHGAAPGGRGSLILMQPVAKNLAMMDGEDAHFDDDGMGNTPSASRVRESRIVKQREGEMDQNLEGLPTGHQVIKASQISNQRRSIGSFDSEPGSEPGSLPGSIISKRTPQTDEVGEVDITSLE